MRCLSRLLSRSSITHEEKPSTPAKILDSSLLDLPIEILVAIEAFLPYENAVAFSLTCKTLYNLFFKLHKPSPKHHGREAHLLRLIEKDLPNQLSCSVHERLYSWRMAKLKHYQCPICTSKKRAFPGCLVICNKGCKSPIYSILEPERRLMLRHGLLGPEFGISRRTIDHVCRKSLPKRANEVTLNIVNGSLMVWRTHHYTARVDFQTWADLSLERFDEAICVHSKAALQALLCAAIGHAKRLRESMIFKIASKTQVVSTGHWQCPTLFKCQTCATDIRLEMDQVSENEVVVRFDVYQDLGGLNEVTLAQRQVLGAKFDRRQKELEIEERLRRQREDLEQRYHGVENQLEGDKIGSRMTYPKSTAFLHQWTYSPGRNLMDPIVFWPDLFDLNQEKCREICFIPQKIGLTY